MSTNQPSLQPTVEDYDSDGNSSEKSSSQDTVESSQQTHSAAQGTTTRETSANVKTASDSGYSSRTAATGDSLDSAQSSDKTAVPGPAVVRSAASLKKKKQKIEDEDVKNSSSTEPSLDQKQPTPKPPSQRMHSRKDKEKHNSAQSCPACEQGRCTQSSSRITPLGPFSGSIPYPSPATHMFSMPSPVAVFHPGNPSFFPATAVQPRPSPMVIQTVQPRTSSLGYARPSMPSPEARLEARGGAASYHRNDSMRTPLLHSHPPTPRLQSSPNVSHSVRYSPTYHTPFSSSPTRNPRHRFLPLREGRPSHPSRPARRVSLCAPEIHYDRDEFSFETPGDRNSQPSMPPRRDSYESSYPVSVDDIRIDHGRHFYEDWSEDEYDDLIEYSEPILAVPHQQYAPRYATDSRPPRPARPRPVTSYSGSGYPLGLDQYDHFDARPHYIPDPQSVIRTSHRPETSVARFRRPSHPITSGTMHAPVSHVTRFSNLDSDDDRQNAAAYHRTEVEAELYQAERSGYPRHSNARQLEDVKRIGREQLRNEIRSQAESSHEGSNASDALKLTINNQTLTITQEEGVSTEIIFPNNRRQTRYSHEGSMKSSGATSRSSRHRTLQSSSRNQAVPPIDNRTRGRQGTPRKPSSASRYEADDHNYENL